MLFARDPSATRDDLAEPWRVVLTNQFHDILPGSSIREVNTQAENELCGVCDAVQAIARRELGGERDEACVWNPASASATGVVESDNGLVFVRDVPAASVVPRSHIDPDRLVQSAARVLDNGRIRVELNESGEIVSLRASSGGELVSSPLLRYRLFRDRPHMWDAWEIDPDYELDEVQHGANIRAEMTVALSEPLRGIIVCKRAIGESSSIETRYVLDAESPLLGVEINIDWHESRRLLRVDVPTSISTRSAVAGTQFGAVERPTHRNTSWDRARFEFPAHRFVSLGQPGLGLAVIAPDVFGWSCHGSTIGASLLRSPEHPDPLADRGKHRFVLGLMPHGGDWREARISSVAERFARPLRAVRGRATGRILEWSVQGAARPELSALMPDPRDPGSVIARFVETEGRTGSIGIEGPGKVLSIEATDALGQETLATHERGFAIPIGAGQILTLRIRLDR